MRATEEIHDAIARYHDLAASRYDSNWGIGYSSFGVGFNGANIPIGGNTPAARNLLSGNASSGRL